MSSAFGGQADADANQVPARTPVARVSRGALERNAAAAAEAGLTTYAPSLLRADAWGHGAATVTGVLERSGFVPAPPGSPYASSLSRAADPRIAVLTPEALYGLPGIPGTAPAMRLVGSVLATKDLRAGEGVSYGYLYRAPVDTRIALVTGGYAQGVVRSLGNAAEVTFAGTRHRIVGRVAMDVCVVEIADAAIDRGNEAVFFGDPLSNEPSVGEWATYTGLSAPELVTAVGLHANRQEVL